MSKGLIRWALATVVVGVGVLGLSGRWSDPILWVYTGVWSATAFYALVGMDEDLARERFTPPTRGADRFALLFIQLLGFGHLAVGALDVGRWHVTAPVPTPIRTIALPAMALAALLVFRSMRENRFFSSVVRIQSERGHRVVDSGPYAIVRHPGYLGMMIAIPLSAIALGSWVSLGIATLYSALIVRRVLFEDGFLRHALDGYTEYTRRVQSRLIPGVW